VDTFIIACENGHRIRASAELSGQTHPCPKCRKPVMVPIRRPQPVNHPLTDTKVIRILSEMPPSPAAPRETAEQPEQRACPRCSRWIDINLSVCAHCDCYAGALPDFMGKLLLASVRKPA